MRYLLIAIGTLLLVAPVDSASAADGRGIAITGAQIYTLSEAGRIENGVLLVRDGRIEAVGADLSVPEGYEVIDAAGRIVTPGLIESYSSLGLVEISGERTTVDSAVAEYPSGASFDVRYALNPAAVALAVNRRDGVTRAVTVPRPGNDPFAGWGALIRLGGEPMLVQPELGMFAAVGAAVSAYVGGSRAAVIQRVRRGLTLAASYNPNRYQPGPGDFSHQDLAALRRFRNSDAPLVVSVDRANEIREAVSLADDFDLDLIVVGGAEAWQEADLLARQSVAVVVNVLGNLPSSYERLGARHDNATLLHAAGVRVLLTAAESQNARKIRQMAGNAVAHGMPWEAALAAMTREAATAWGMEKGAGTLSEGAPADLVIWTGDPLELTEWAEAVLIDGAWQDMSSRQTRLFDRYEDPADPDRAYR
jgi:imidazolonepropionase-like amidohydrolase